ncbi:MAG: hypothetical protein IJ387_03095 [Thermoguttaceae bacterium]|nr:hypothetical protein [Thermoguttaceae bacterium]
MKRFFWTVGTTAALTVACCGGCDKGQNGDTPSNNGASPTASGSSIDAGKAAL